jgi:hypothetical protein
VSASEGERFAQVIAETVETILETEKTGKTT